LKVLKELAPKLDLAGMVTASGRSLTEVVEAKPTMLLFLRHSGCAFCREALSDLAKQRAAIESEGVQPVVVHMMSVSGGEAFLQRYGLTGVDHIGDPERTLYRAFGLGRGRVTDLLRPTVWRRGVEAVLAGHLAGPAVGDVLQMPGLVIVHRDHILAEFEFKTPADRPDYIAFAKEALTRTTE
jgi:peroxiredoxin